MRRNYSWEFAISFVLVISCEPILYESVNVETESRNVSSLEAQLVNFTDDNKTIIPVTIFLPTCIKGHRCFD